MIIKIMGHRKVYCGVLDRRDAKISGAEKAARSKQKMKQSIDPIIVQFFDL
jgi:hypothetical protein